MRKEAELLWNARDKDRDILYHCRKSAIIKNRRNCRRREDRRKYFVGGAQGGRGMKIKMYEVLQLKRKELTSWKKFSYWGTALMILGALGMIAFSLAI